MKFSISALLGRKNTVKVTAVNIKLHGKIHTLPGAQSSSGFLDVEIPFTNKPNQNILMFQAQKKKPERITSIEVARPFVLVGATPKTPIEVEENQKVVFRLRIELPKYSYSGPVDVEMKTEDPEMVHVELSKTVLVRGGKSVEVENSNAIIMVQKNGIFQQSIQMYKALSHNDTVRRVLVPDPFKLVSTDPKLPFTVSDENSYIVAFYIQAPDHNYAGPLTIELE
jgi:hypothetical protein